MAQAEGDDRDKQRICGIARVQTHLSTLLIHLSHLLVPAVPCHLQAQGPGQWLRADCYWDLHLRSQHPC